MDRRPQHTVPHLRRIRMRNRPLRCTPVREQVTATRKWLTANPSVHISPSAEAIFQQHSGAFSTSARGIGHLKAEAGLHAALEQNVRKNAIEIGEVDAAFASQLRIFDRPRWWEKTEMP